MTSKILIDYREHSIIDIIKHKNILSGIVEFCNLPIGDIIYKVNDVIKIIVERKTYKDLANSIIDKRTKNQAYRLKESDSKIIYLIEGDFINKNTKFYSNITYDSIMSSIMNRMLKDNFYIFHTKNIDETVYFIEKLFSKLNLVTDESVPKCYVDTLSFSKKSYNTNNNCYISQLMQINGVSATIATVISEKYNSMYELIEAYNKNGKHCLSSILINNRKIGNILSERIYTVLFNTQIPQSNLSEIKEQEENHINANVSANVSANETPKPKLKLKMK